MSPGVGKNRKSKLGGLQWNEDPYKLTILSPLWQDLSFMKPDHTGYSRVKNYWSKVELKTNYLGGPGEEPPGGVGLNSRILNVSCRYRLTSRCSTTSMYGWFRSNLRGLTLRGGL